MQIPVCDKNYNYKNKKNKKRNGAFSEIIENKVTPFVMTKHPLTG